MEQFTTLVEKQSNETIYKEVNRILKHFTSNFPAEKICKELIKCGKGNTTSKSFSNHVPTVRIENPKKSKTNLKSLRKMCDQK